MRKEWYKVTFYAKMSQDDVHAMNKYLYDTMNEAMEIEECEGLEITQDEPTDYHEPEYDLSLSSNADEYELDMRNGNIILDAGLWKETFEEKGFAEIGKEIKIYFEDEDVDDPYRAYKVTSIDNSEIALEYISLF